MYYRLIFSTGLVLALCSCAPTVHQTQASVDDEGSGDPPPQTFVFECADDYQFVARIESDKAWLFLPGRTISLPLAQSDAGFEYTDGSDTFRRRGDEADLANSATMRTACRNNRAKAIWEHAKLNGVDFRATGNEPGWCLEISNQHDILLVTDYGQTTWRFVEARIESAPHGRKTTYRARSGSAQLSVVITGAPCTDTMSGESFPAAVSVRLNDKRYSGCGRALH